MKKTLSPYYITIPLNSPATGLTCSQYTLELYVWEGSKSAPPSIPTYSKTVSNSLADTGSHTINISRLINDYVDITPESGTGTSLINGNNQSWVKTQVFYTTSNATEATSPQSVDSDIIVRGYSYGNEGPNQDTPANKNLITGSEFNVSRSGTFVLPIKIDETVFPTANILITDVTLDSGSTWTVTFTTVGTYSDLTATIRPTVGSPELYILSGVTNPRDIEVSFTGQSVDISLSGYDNDTQQEVYSNTYTIST